MDETDSAYLLRHKLPDVVNMMMEDMLLDRPEDVYRWIERWAEAKGAPPLPNSFADLLTPCVWTMEEHGTDLIEVDQQHGKLFKLVNQLVQIAQGLLQGDAGTPAQTPVPYALVLPVAQELMAYTQYHFAEEEQHFLPTDYPQKDEHVAKHRAFEARFVRFLEGVEKQTAQAQDVVAALRFLKDWLISHVKTVDREYLEYLPSRMHVYANNAETLLVAPPRRQPSGSR